MLTKLEKEFMDIIATCEMNQGNGADPDCADDVNTYLWIDERAADMGITEKACVGVVASLVKKGYAWTTQEGNDSGVGMSEEGFKVWKEVV